MEYLWVAKMEFDRIGGGLGYIYIYVNVRSLEMKRNLVHLFKDWRTQLTLFRRMETYSMLFLVWQMLSGELTPFTNCRPWRKTVDQGNHYLCILYVLKGHDKTAVITSFFLQLFSFRYILMQFNNNMGLMFSTCTFICAVQKNDVSM